MDKQELLDARKLLEAEIMQAVRKFEDANVAGLVVDHIELGRAIMYSDGVPKLTSVEVSIYLPRRF